MRHRPIWIYVGAGDDFVLRIQSLLQHEQIAGRAEIRRSQVRGPRSEAIVLMSPEPLSVGEQLDHFPGGLVIQAATDHANSGDR